MSVSRIMKISGDPGPEFSNNTPLTMLQPYLNHIPTLT